MDGDLGHSSRLRDGGQHHMPSGAAYGPFSSHVCTATMALAVRHDGCDIPHDVRAERLNRESTSRSPGSRHIGIII